MSSKEINKLSKDFNNNSLQPIELESFLRAGINTSNSLKTISQQCVIKKCFNDAEKIYYIHKLGQKLRNSFLNVLKQQEMQGWKGQIFTLTRKQVLLCENCYVKINFGKLSIDSVNTDYTFEIKGEI